MGEPRRVARRSNSLSLAALGAATTSVVAGIVAFTRDGPFAAALVSMAGGLVALALGGLAWSRSDADARPPAALALIAGAVVTGFWAWFALTFEPS